VEAETRYARSGDAHIAYQVLGEDGPDLLYLSSGTISIDSIDDEPGFARGPVGSHRPVGTAVARAMGR
jgi:hypothetical protein